MLMRARQTAARPRSVHVGSDQQGASMELWAMGFCAQRTSGSVTPTLSVPDA